MTPNLLYQQFETKVRALLQVGPEEEDFRVGVVIGMAVRDIVDEFTEDVGSRTVDCLSLCTEEDPCTSGGMSTRIYLPKDCDVVRQVFINDVEVEPINGPDFNREKANYGAIQLYHGRFVRTEDGVCYVEILPTIIDPSSAEVRVNYKVSSDDLGLIPRRYENLTIYGAAKHYYNFIHLENPVMKSQLKSAYKEYLGEMKARQANTITKAKRPYEIEWEKSLFFVVDRNDYHIRRQ